MKEWNVKRRIISTVGIKIYAIGFRPCYRKTRGK
jgi:hypothetical protein